MDRTKILHQMGPRRIGQDRPQAMLLALVLAMSGACGSRAHRSETVQAIPQPTPTSDVAAPTAMSPAPESAAASPMPGQTSDASTTMNPTPTCDMQAVTREEFFAANLRNPDGTPTLSSGAASAADVEAGRLAVRGSLSKEVIRRIMRRHADKIRVCFESVLSEKPTPQVTMHFVINPDGTVGDIKLARNASSSSELPCCIAHAMRAWTFPKPEGGGVVAVTNPFTAN